MKINLPKTLATHISFKYTSFDRVVLRGYIQGLFVEGSVINMLRNLGFKTHSNAVLRILTDQLTARNPQLLLHPPLRNQPLNFFNLTREIGH